MQAGQLERRHWGPPATLQQHDAGISKVRCPNHISLAQLKAAYAEFKVNQLPGLVAAAAQTGDGAQGTAPPQAAQTDSSDASQHRQAPAASLVKQDLHTSATTGAVTGMAPPAYATQMDGPNDVLDAVATNAAAGVEELCRAGVAHRDDEGVLESGDKRDRPTLDAVDGAPAKKAKLGKPLSFLLASLFSGPHKWPGLLWLAQRCLVLATGAHTWGNMHLSCKQHSACMVATMSDSRLAMPVCHVCVTADVPAIIILHVDSTFVWMHPSPLCSCALPTTVLGSHCKQHCSVTARMLPTCLPAALPLLHMRSFWLLPVSSHFRIA